MTFSTILCPHSIAIAVVTVLFVFIIRVILVLQQIKSAKANGNTSAFRKIRKRPVRTLAVLGSGGHTTEMLHLLTSVTSENYTPLNYVMASSDTTSKNRLGAFDASTAKSPSDKSGHSKTLPPYNEIYTIPRAREVGQSYFTSIFTTINSILHSARIVLIDTRPDLLLINGPGTCLPIALCTFMARVMGVCEGKIVFCESFCRVKSLSLTGSLLQKIGIVDLFLVHWPELLDKNKKGDNEMVLIDSFILHSDD